MQLYDGYLQLMNESAEYTDRMIQENCNELKKLAMMQATKIKEMADLLLDDSNTVNHAYKDYLEELGEKDYLEYAKEIIEKWTQKGSVIESGIMDTAKVPNVYVEDDEIDFGDIL